MSDKISEARCELCGELMPESERMFKFHGYSGPCPKPLLPKASDNISEAALTLEQVTECLNRASDGKWNYLKPDILGNELNRFVRALIADAVREEREKLEACEFRERILIARLHAHERQIAIRARGKNDMDKTEAEEREANSVLIENLAMLIRRFAARYADGELAGLASTFLRGKGLQGSILRARGKE